MAAIALTRLVAVLRPFSSLKLTTNVTLSMYFKLTLNLTMFMFDINRMYCMLLAVWSDLDDRTVLWMESVRV